MKKFLITGAVAFAMTFSLNASAISVADLSSAELVQLIAQLQAQINVLESGNQGSTTTTASEYNHISTLSVGSRGSQVADLQACLGINNDGDFGRITKTAVISFQASRGLVNDGIVGPSTGTAISSSCSVTTIAKTKVETKVETKITNEKFVTTSGEEAEISIDDIDSDDDLDNNKKDQKAFTFTVEADEKGGSAQIERVDLSFVIDPKDDGEEDIYDIIEKVTIEVDGKEIADESSDDDDDWRKLDDSNKKGTIRISGLDTVVNSDEKVDFDVILDIADLDDKDDLDLYIKLINVEVRYTDEAGISDTDDENSTEKVSVESAENIDFDLDENRQNPEVTTIALGDDNAKDVSLVVADVQVDDADGTLEEVKVVINITTTKVNGSSVVNTDELLDEVTLYIDGKEIDDDDAKEKIAAAAEAGEISVTYTFDTDDYDLEDGEEYTFELKGNFNELDEGSLFIGSKVKVVSIFLEGEEENGDDFDTTKNTSFAKDITASAGALVLKDSKISVRAVGQDETAARFEFEIEVKADGDEDIRVDSFVFNVGGSDITLTLNEPTAPDILTDKKAGTWTFEVEDEDGDTITTATDIINDGSTETYTVKFIFDPTNTGSYDIEFKQIKWTEDTGKGILAVPANGNTPAVVADLNAFVPGNSGVLDLNLESEDIDLVK